MPRNQVEELLNARAEIDEELRRHKNLLSVMFTDIVGSTSYFDRFGDTAGLSMVHLNAELGTTAVHEFGGTVVKTIGDSVMADFPDPRCAVKAAIAMQRRLADLNSELPDHRRVQIRIGIHCGMGFRKGTDVFGDVVNLAARITKRTDAGQILISKSVQEATANDGDIPCQWLDKCTIDGRTEQEDIFEVIWTDPLTYAELRRNLQRSHSAARQNDPAVVPKLPSRYEVLDKIGQGGVGIVYKARDLQTNEVLALKVLKPEAASDATAQANFSKELSLARKITHKNVCRIYDLYRSEGVAYASMEYVEGENLLNVLSREGRITVARALNIIKQLCSGLGEAHAQGVVHRDLKPANIMVDASGTVKIMDFGIARMMETGVGQTATIVGTPAYMSPEQTEGKSADARSDIYAIGLIFYEMVTGRATFSGDTMVAIAMKQVTEAPKSPCKFDPTIPKQIEKVILKCLEKNPSQRFQSISELTTALEHSPNPSNSGQLSSDHQRAWMPEQLNGIKRYFYGAGVQINRRIVALSETLSKPMPQRISIGDRQIGTRHFLVLASGAFLTTIVGFTILGHSHKAKVPSSAKPANSRAAVSISTQSSTHTAISDPVAPVATPPSLLGNAISRSENLDADGSDVSQIEEPKKTKQATTRDGVASHPVPKKASRTQSPSPVTGQTTPLLASKPAPPAASLPSTPSGNSILDNAPSESLKELPGPAEPSTITGPIAATDKYFDVGSFKESKWADDASETLKKLGFHTVLLHKGKLWMNSYHVIVGPFHDDDGAQAARKDLESRGFKPRVTKID